MPRPKIMVVYGTRPEAIKVAPFIKASKSDPRFKTISVSTGQHREMVAQVQDMFEFAPEIDLKIMKPGQSLNAISRRVIRRVDKVLRKKHPSVVVVQGDTTTAMATAIASFNVGIPVVHLEAGLRTGNIHSPFPEEANRKIITQVTDLHLAPTPESKANLIREGIEPHRIAVTGNTVIDALMEAQSWDTEFSDPLLRSLNPDARMIMVTTHRRENIDTMSAIGRAMRGIAERFPDVVLVLPAHLNPAVRAAVLPEIQNLDNVIITDPEPYDEFTKLMAMSTIVLTDSGGVQEEAPSLGKPVLVMRENTERPEAVTAGTVKLVGTNEQRIIDETTLLLTNDAEYFKMANAVNPYGDGKASLRSLDAIAHLLGIGERSEDFLPLEKSM